MKKIYLNNVKKDRRRCFNCKKREFDLEPVVICNKTGKGYDTFDNVCKYYKRDAGFIKSNNTQKIMFNTNGAFYYRQGRFIRPDSENLNFL